MSDLDGQNLRLFPSRGAGITRMTDGAGAFGSPAGRPAGSGAPIRRLSAPSTQPFPVVPPGTGQGAGDHVDDLLAGYALGALEEDERLAVERHADFCPACARQLAELRGTAAMLPFAVAPASPSPNVRAALFSRIAQSTGPFPAVPVADAEPVSDPMPRPQVTLPASGSWVESIPTPRAASRAPRRRSPMRVLGVATPVVLTFGLLALFLVPQWLPDGNDDSAQLAEFLSSTGAQCTSEDAATRLIASAGLSACGVFQPDADATSQNAVGTLFINDVEDVTPDQYYTVSIPMLDGGYEPVGTVQVDRGSGMVSFERPDGSDLDGQFCITDMDEDPDTACGLTPAA